MKLIDIITENEEEITSLLKKTLIFSLPGGEENVAVQVSPALLNKIDRRERRTLLDLHVELFIETDTMRSEMFQEIMEGVTAILQKRGISDENVMLRFKEFKVHKDKLTVDLFKFIDLVNTAGIKRMVKMVEIANGNDKFTFNNDFLPSIDSDYSTDIVLRTERAKNIYRVFRKGKINGVPYELPQDYIKLIVVPDYDKFDFIKNVISPHFMITIISYLPKTNNENDVDSLLSPLRDRFDNMDIYLSFRN